MHGLIMKMKHTSKSLSLKDNLQKLEIIYSFILSNRYILVRIGVEPEATQVMSIQSLYGIINTVSRRSDLFCRLWHLCRYHLSWIILELCTATHFWMELLSHCCSEVVRDSTYPWHPLLQYRLSATLTFATYDSPSNSPGRVHDW